MPIPFYFDWTILIIIPAAILAVFAQSKVNSTFAKYSRIGSLRGYTGADVARQLLNIAGITDVTVEPIRGNLTDHYDPRSKILRLSEPVYNSTSISALGVAAHETGHAIQHNNGYLPLAIRNTIYPVVNISSKLSTPLIMIGLIFGFLSGSLFFLQLGIILFSAVVLFQIITLPVEFNASSRAINMLEQYSFLNPEEVAPAKKVLGAAAMTYVASAAVAISNLIRLLLIANRRRD